jgi:ribonuclease P protein component
MSVRFGPAVRLRSRHEFTAVQQRGRRVGARYVTVLGHPNTLGHHRLGLIASRRLGGAVERNRTKRRLREIFRRHVAGGATSRGWDVVVIGRTGAAEAPFAALEADFLAAVQRLHGAKRASA